MNKMNEKMSHAHYFAALKLIEQLYKDKMIPTYMYHNILNEYASVVDLSKFISHNDKEAGP